MSGAEGRYPRAFRLVRHQDVSGVSGTGLVAEGVEFSSGVVALTWLSPWPTSVVFHDRGMASVEAIHGHGGATRIVFDRPDEESGYCENQACCSERGHEGKCDERAAL